MPRQHRTILACISYLIAAVVVAVPLRAALAVTITVNATTDDTIGGDGRCTLREAVANVNAAADTTGGDCAGGTGAGDTIDFQLKKLPAKIKLVLGKLVLAQDVTITGPTVGVLSIFGNHLDRVFEITADAASISDLIIRRGGAAGSEGGGILVDIGASLTLTNCTLKGNRASGGFGGAISNRGTATLTNCVLSSNGAAFGGGGLYNAGMATLTNCTLIRNLGGGIGNFGGTVILTNSTITLNKANDGGGIGNFGGNVALTNCTFRRNQAFLGAGLDNFGGTAALTNCTFSHNSATRFGGILNSGMVTLTNSTLTTNRSSRSNGGALFNSGIATITNCTVTSNFVNRGFSGGGLYNVGTATLANTIVANSRNGQNCGGSPITSNGYNLSSDASCFTSGGTDLIETEPMLAVLANFGGPTDTHALCAGVDAPDPSCTGVSPAIDAGDDAVTGPPDSLNTDQRGEPRVAGLHVDIGAYETQ
jgi:CSLREA domain-containing protein